ncbi:hypothetical protein JTE90_021407 [Oedothorax gibbosus]|uniref:NADH dehydrogenase [ubiquinone] 1 beta subcomplex subunit 8, mitochondrial n=1 Tax=Oedothorax gibbosus TaxID=931172 RepID=A0AAV6VFW0_9ARAC|nr:hypothetical protein JTE90_021407 [Oedothorax gibbosus]
MLRSLSTVRKAINSSKNFRTPFTASRVITRNSSVTTWNKDWKPGPYPRTEEERLAAAKKYNLIPEDYEPYPEDEGMGDYPMFKKFHNESRDQFEPYDYWCLKRNFGEPVHTDVDIFQEDKINFQLKMPFPLWQQFIYLMGGLSIFWGILYYDLTHPYNQRKVPKQFPLDGMTYYTFEADE